MFSTPLPLHCHCADPHHAYLNNNRLSEQFVQDAFHTFLKSSLAQAKTKGIINADLLSSAEADIMIAGINEHI
jgi:hypothetical protein